MARLDLRFLGSGETFQSLCFHLIKREFPEAIHCAIGSWDGGRDIVSLNDGHGDIVWQCKFTRNAMPSSLKSKIIGSLNSLNPDQKISWWILCLSNEVSGSLLDWLRKELKRYPFIKKWQVWDAREIERRLKASPEIVEIYFSPLWHELSKYFQTESLELVRFRIDSKCGWKQLHRSQIFGQADCKESADLIFDVVVRNRGTLECMIDGLNVELTRVTRKLRGLPGEGLLFPQFTYEVSLDGGKPGIRVVEMEPPVVVRPGRHERFKVRLTDAGFAWSGYLRLLFKFGKRKKLALPWVWLQA